MCGYHSANSEKISDRLVEPFEFTANYLQCWCYDIDNQAVKLFKTSRISNVELLENEWQHSEKHTKLPIDIFRISSDQLLPIKLRLTVRAMNLLVEEYPLSDKFLEQESANSWLLTTEVCAFEGVGRFILGLYDDIEIVESAALKKFISEKIKKMR